MTKKWLIQGKGYFNGSVTNPFNLNLQISDINYSYGHIEFSGSKKSLEKFIDALIENESTFKMIDYFEKDSKEHHYYMWGPDNILKPK